MSIDMGERVTDISDSDWSVPDGLYICEIANAEDATKSGAKYPQVLVEFEILEGTHKGKKMRNWIVLTAIGKGQLKNLCEAVFCFFYGFNVEEERLIGRYVDVEFKTETYQGQKRSRAVSFYPPSAQNFYKQNEANLYADETNMEEGDPTPRERLLRITGRAKSEAEPELDNGVPF